ncbi:MAG: alkaline phosphatase, partial [Oscillospiraceae bacterium]|nr:alkaline phosphatase [Oscillospiraceae bacterium]
WGMFAADAMAYDFDIKENTPDEPSLAEMTKKAIELLSQNENGFFLMVEGSKVDWAAHANDPIGLISDILAFDDAVKVALDFAKKNQNTMLLIMSDHGNGGITIGNYDTDASYSKDPVSKFIAPLKKAKLTGEGVAAKFNEDRTNIKSAMKTYYGIDDLTDEEEAAIKETPAGSMNYTVGPMISKRAYLGWTTTGHTGEEVNLYTYLPSDGRITGTIDNTDIAKICAAAFGIDLDKVTAELYNDAEAAFKAKGATVEIEAEIQAGGRMTVTKDDDVLIILENKNYVILNDEKVEFDSVVVNQSGKFYVSAAVIDLIP